MDKQIHKIAKPGQSGRHPSFRLIGFQTHPVTEPQEAINTWRNSVGKTSIIYLTEDIARPFLGYSMICIMISS